MYNILFAAANVFTILFFQMHIVTYNLQYADLSSAADKDKGLAVLGFFFQVPVF